jgi:hypothetical protein
MKQRFIVISVFVPGHGRGAQLGQKDPNISRSSVDDIFENVGMKLPWHQRTELDPMWYLLMDGRPVGYVRVFDQERFARQWFNALRNKTEIWAYWHKGFPLPWMKDRDIKLADQFLCSMALCRVRAFSAHGAAKSGWDNWSAGRLTADDVYLDRDASRRTTENVVHGARSEFIDTSALTVKSTKWQVQETAISRTYEISGLPPPEPTTSLKIRCSLLKALSGHLLTSVDFELRPYLYLQPSRQPLPDHLVDPPFTAALTAESGTFVEGTEFAVIACFVEDQPDTTYFQVRKQSDILLCVRALLIGGKMAFSIFDKTDHRVKLCLPLPNDSDFARL